MNKTLSGLYIYPVKSCRGISLNEVSVGSMGPQWDRRWMLVDLNGRFINQAKCPKLALVSAIVSKDNLLITFPDGTSHELPLNAGEQEVEVELWNDKCRAVDQGKVINQAFSHFLNVECSLVFIPDDFIRPVDPKYATTASDHVSFADGFPFLVISEASLEDLNSRLKADVPMNRFRPNLVISGCKPYEEDSWKRIQIGELQFEIVKPCPRCVVTTVEQSTGVKGLEPLKTLAKYRKHEKEIMFGQNAIHLNHGLLRLGDNVEVLVL